MAFYEPLHGILARGREALMALRADAWASGHPHMEAPYFSEFLPLLKESGGVRHYDPGFEMDRFDVDADAELPELKWYLDSLLSAAKERRKVAVLKFCRSMGRLRWMMRAFPDAAHVVVLRNPAAQWASSWSQMSKHGNPWFVAAPYRVLGANLGSARVRGIMGALECDVPDFHAVISQPSEEGCIERVKSVPLDLSYRVWIAHWTLSAMSVNQGISAIVDSDLLSVSRQYADLCTGQLHRVTRLKPVVSNAHPAITSQDQRPLIDWMGLDDEPVHHWHRKVAGFVQTEIGNDASERMAFSVIQSKFAMADEQAKRGGLPFDPSESDWMDRSRYCVDELSLRALLLEKSPSSETRTGFRTRMETVGRQIGMTLRLVDRW